MKKYSLLCVVFFFVCFIFIAKIEHNYSLNGVIVEKENNMFTVEDITGNLWVFESEENYSINDNVKIWYNDNCSTNRIDDIITKVKKVRGNSYFF